jgi:hypothetical protein
MGKTLAIFIFHIPRMQYEIIYYQCYYSKTYTH